MEGNNKLAKRKPVSQSVESEVLTNCRRRCCLCAYLNDDWNLKSGQIAHIDQNPANSDYANLAFLCLDHHDQYDSKTSQSKGLRPGELRQYRDQLYDEIESKIGVCEADNNAPGQLRVDASPTWDRRTLLAQIRFENVGVRPIRVETWYYHYCKDGKEGAVGTVEDSLPVILREREGHEFLAPLTGCDPLDLTEMGVVDSDNNRWPVPNARVRSFAATANAHRFPDHLLPPEELMPLDHEGQDVNITFEAKQLPHCQHLCLVAQIENTGSVDLPIYSVSMEWEYDPPRGQSSGDGPRATEIGGSFQLGSPIGRDRIPCGETAQVVIGDEWARSLMSAMSPDVPRDKVIFKIKTSRTYCWTESGEKLMEPVEQVARSAALWISRRS